MSASLPWLTALKIAWRESRASAAKFMFVILAVAIGTGTLTGVRGFSRAFRGMLLRDARTLMAADLTIRVFELPSPAQQAAFDDLTRKGVERTWVTETVSMLSSNRIEAPVLIAVKATDPSHYPFYGEVKMQDGRTLAQTVAGDGIAVSEDLLIRSGLTVGSRVRIGTKEFTIAGVILAEPDRMTGSVNVGPRVMMTRENLVAAGLLQPGSRSSQRYLFKFPPAKADQMIQTSREELKKVFEDAVISDYRETHPLITRGLGNATTFLSLISLIALVVGSLGVAMAMQSHLQAKMDSIAIMKSLGGRSSQILRIYLVQVLLLALAGGLLGLAIGLVIQQVFPLLIASFFPVAPKVDFEWISIAEGLGLAILSTLLFTLPPLLSIRHIRPILILRRDMETPAPPLGERWKRWRAPLAAGVLILLGLAGMAVFLIDTPNWRDAGKVGAWFVGGLAGSLLLLSALSWLLLRGLRWLVRLPALRIPALARHGLANIYRPGNHAEAVLVALSVGVMFTLTIYLLQSSLIGDIAQSAPPGMPNIFVLNITDNDRLQVEQFLRSSPDVEGSPMVIATAAGRLKTIDGKSIAPVIDSDRQAKRFLRARQLTWAGPIPRQTTVLQGQWWKQEQPVPPQVSVLDDAARILHLHPGDTLQFDINGKTINARVAAIHRTESVRPGANLEFIFSPGALHNVPMLYFGSAKVKANRIAELQKQSFARFPGITVINLADVLDRVQEVIDQVALVVRFISGFSILAGMIILAASVAGSRLRRVREVVILKTLGATRRKVAGIFSIEFLLLGTVAGLMGSLLASGFTNILLTRVLDAPFHFNWWPNFVAIGGSALIANAAGWLASYRILDQKPLEILRNE